MIENKLASNGILNGRFSAKVLNMSKRELRERVSYITRYLQNISPKVSVYASLERERVECAERLKLID